MRGRNRDHETWKPLRFPPYFSLEVFDAETQRWIAWAYYRAEQVHALGRNAYVAVSDGMPVYFRCVQKEEDWIISVAGTGELIRYRVTEQDHREEER